MLAQALGLKLRTACPDMRAISRQRSIARCLAKPIGGKNANGLSRACKRSIRILDIFGRTTSHAFRRVCRPAGSARLRESGRTQMIVARINLGKQSAVFAYAIAALYNGRKRALLVRADNRTEAYALAEKAGYSVLSLDLEGVRQ